ncbi:MAG: HAMP domain-containing sensor histidine kinase [Bacillota bacterium]|nr:HAMP domain-containing sensor histidine kinase [Bacillota bacterium]
MFNSSRSINSFMIIAAKITKRKYTSALVSLSFMVLLSILEYKGMDIYDQGHIFCLVVAYSALIGGYYLGLLNVIAMTIFLVVDFIISAPGADGYGFGIFRMLVLALSLFLTAYIISHMKNRIKQQQMEIHEGRERYDRLIKQNERIANDYEYNDKLRSELLANISHELRTPINVIFSALQLEEVKLNELSIEMQKAVGKYIHTMKQNCYRLLRLINNIIDVTKIGAGYLHLNRSRWDIVGLVEGITMSVADYIKSKSIDIIFDTDVEEKSIICDGEKVETIVLNLLSNAVKFTDAGGKIFVNIHNGDKYIDIIVRDTGVGIPEDKLNIVFDRFKQVEGSLYRNRDGSGIGLSLTKSLIQLHGGTINVKSQVGNGTEFIVHLPVIETEGKSVTKENDDSLNYTESLIKDNVEKIKIEFSDIYSFEQNINKIH